MSDIINNSEFRYDPLSNTWVLIAPGRAKRPSLNAQKENISPLRGANIVTDQKAPNKCPFCAGNEDMTPEPELFAILSDNNIVRVGCYEHQNKINKNIIKNRGWKIRVVPNKFGVLKIEGELTRTGKGIYQTMNGMGTHEVLIEHPGPEHVFIFDQDIELIENSLLALQWRNMDIKKDKRFKYAVIFKNHGAAAGASIFHAHWQHLCLPITPRRIECALNSSRSYYMTNHHCIFCRIIKDTREGEHKDCCIEENDYFIATANFASRFPYETHIYPKIHDEKTYLFEDICAEKRNYLARILKNTLRRLKYVIENELGKEFNFNLEIYNSPWFENYNYPHSGDTIKQDFHWHIQIQPRGISQLAGFELGTGFYINIVSPETAAKQLRSAKI